MASIYGGAERHVAQHVLKAVAVLLTHLSGLGPEPA